MIMSLLSNPRWWGAAVVLAAGAAAGVLLVDLPSARTAPDASKAAPPAVGVSVAAVEPREVTTWSEFSGRLEAVDRVDVRSRVSGAIHAVHFREGSVVKQGDLLVTIDPAPYAAEVDRSKAQVAAAEARVAFTKAEVERGKQLLETRAMSPRDVDQRTNAFREAEANLQAAKAAMQTAELNLGYTEIRAPVAGRVGRLEITVGNLVDAGPSAQILTTLVSVNPIYASFHAEEEIVLSAIRQLGPAAVASGDHGAVQVLMRTTQDEEPVRGRLQLIDNQVDGRTGTVRVRAVFENANARLMPGQFARLSMGASGARSVLAIDERAIGTDQNKRFVFVVGQDNKAAYREVALGAVADGLRIVTSGLSAGDRIVVSGLQRVRPGVEVAPQAVSMGRGTKEALLTTPPAQR